MNQNLDLLRQNYCRPAIATGKATNYLFSLEKECEQGKTLLAQLPKTLLHLQEFNPYGLHKTYRDEASGLELPLFAVFDLQGKHQLTFEITTDSVSGTAEPKSLPSYMPLQTTQESVRKINKERLKAERFATRLSAILGVIPASAFLFAGATALPGFAAPCILVGGWIFGAFLTYVSSLFVLNRFCPWKKLVLTAVFDGLLPKAAREKARAAKDHFDTLYLVVDQHQRWKGSLLPDPRPRALDPLLVGELKQGRCRKFFLIHQFDLTGAEQYLADEFATKL
jgi:hypothetical protein